MQKKGLGKGLQALIPVGENEKDIFEVSVYDIQPSDNQPRKTFDEDKMNELVESIKLHGVIQPIIVNKIGDAYKIIAGERRWRAARIAGLKKVPVVIKEVSKRQSMELSLIENVQRQDLNPIEEAEAYQSLVSEFGLSQEQVAERVGKSRPAVTNALRLLNLEPKVRKMVEIGTISGGHAKTLLSITDLKKQAQVADAIVDKKMSVRETECYIKNINSKKNKTSKKKKDYYSSDIEQTLQSIIGTKVRIINAGDKGKIVIEYYSKDELTRLMELFETISYGRATRF